MTTLLKESFESRLWRWGGNCFPAYRRTGARVKYVAADFHEVHIELPSNWKTKNHLGITWGGSLYAALDPMYGVMLYKLLGRQYRVVEKTATIHFKRPGKSTLIAQFRISKEELGTIKNELQNNSKLERTYLIDLVDQQGVIHASCEKVISISSHRNN